MKLSDVVSYLEIFKMTDKTRALHEKGQHELSQIQILDYYYSCMKLEQFIEEHTGEDELDQQHLHKLSQLLANRWSRTIHTNSAYLSDTSNPANGLYYLLAADLQQATGISRYKFIMPTLLREESSISLKKLSDKDMRFADFVLTDDASDFIEVLPCLKIFADSGVFSTTNVGADGTTRELSDTEEKSVVLHSNHAEQFIKAVCEIHRIKNSLGTIGFALKALALQLRQGSVLEQGVEKSAGSVAYPAIQQFSELLSELSEAQHEDLITRSFRDVAKNEISFADVWSILTRESKSRPTNAAACVQTLSEQIEGILKNNLDLFNIKVGSGQKAVLDFEYYQQKLEQAEQKLSRFFYQREPAVRSFVYPAENENAIFDAIISDAISHSLLTSMKLIPLYRELNQENKNKFILALMNLGEPGYVHLTKEIKRFNQLREILETLNEEEKFTLLSQTNLLNKLLKPKEKKRKAEHVDDLLLLLNQFEHKKRVLNLISDTIFNLYEEYPEIQEIMKQTQEGDEIVKLSLLFTAAEWAHFAMLPTEPQPSSSEGVRAVIDLVSSEEEEYKRDIEEKRDVEQKHNDAMDLDEPTLPLTGTQSISTSADAVPQPLPQPLSMGSEEPAVTEPAAPSIDITRLPPKKRARLLSVKRSTESPVSVVSTSVPTFFNPMATPIAPDPDTQVYDKLRKKAQDCIRDHRPLEAIHYLKRAYDCLYRLNYCFDANRSWRSQQKQAIMDSVHQAIKVMGDNWEECFLYYETRVERQKLNEWRACAIDFAKQMMIRPKDKLLLIYFEGYIETLGREHPQFHR